MKKSILSFPDHIIDALQIKNNISSPQENFSSVIISGQGGSAIGGFLILDLLDSKKSEIPLIVNQGYDLPYWANNKTLLIISSYSGNTEETINVYKQGIKNNCYIICLTSGGKLLEMAIKNNIEYCLLPSGFQPRAAIGYSIVQLFNILNDKKICISHNSQNLDSFKNVAFFLKDNQSNIKKEAKKISDLIDNNISIMYCSSLFSSSALRFKQQINENSKSHCWFNIIPEMNHNEIVGWSKEYNSILTFFINSSFDTKKNINRISLTQKHIKHYSKTHFISPKGEDVFSQIFYLIHLFDFVSLFLANKKNVDPSKILPIDKLKLGLKNNND